MGGIKHRLSRIGRLPSGDRLGTLQAVFLPEVTHMIAPRWSFGILAAWIACLAAPLGAAEEKPDRKGVDFFEKKIRPVLVQSCYECHSAKAKSVKGGLLVDTREGLRQGGESGAAVVPGNTEESLLIEA